jgi:predicted membrane-bound spermidine synthase
LILLFTLALAALVGAQFPLAGAAANGEPAAVAARLYSADLIGAALGALLVSALLIPLLGVTTVCLFTAGLNAAAAALAWRMTTA